jgi:hypothetical protein
VHKEGTDLDETVPFRAPELDRPSQSVLLSRHTVRIIPCADQREAGRVPDHDQKSLLPYSKEHARLINRMVLTPGEPLVCPACQGELKLGPPVRFEDAHVRQLRCMGCGRGAMIRDR